MLSNRSVWVRITSLSSFLVPTTCAERAKRNQFRLREIFNHNQGGITPSWLNIDGLSYTFPASTSSSQRLPTYTTRTSTMPGHITIKTHIFLTGATGATSHKPGGDQLIICTRIHRRECPDSSTVPPALGYLSSHGLASKTGSSIPVSVYGSPSRFGHVC